MASEILLGEFPEDKAEYDALGGAKIHSISFVQIIDAIETNKITGSFRLAIVGRLYTGGRYISGVSAKMEKQDVINAQKEKGKLSYEQRMQKLFGLDQTPIHITGVSIKPL